MRSREPSIIAAIVKGTLSDLHQQHPALARKVELTMRADLLQTLQKSSRVSWLPLVVDIELTRAIFAVAGPQAATDTFTSMMVEAVSTPLFRPLMEAARRLHGDHPERLVRWAPSVWSTMYRLSGVMEVVHEPDSSTSLKLTELPAVLAEDPLYLTGTAAGAVGLLSALGLRTTVEVARRCPVERDATLRICWL